MSSLTVNPNEDQEQVLLKILDVRSSLMKLDSIDKVVRTALALVQQNLSPQMTAIYRLSKTGWLERIGLLGYDKNGNQLSNDWFPEEKYQPGESFSGCSVPPLIEDHYGKPYITNLM